MKKIIKYSLISVTSLILITIITSTLIYRNYWPKDIYTEINEDYLSYFNETYEDCRKDFLDAGKEISDSTRNVKVGSFKVPSKIDNKLFVDWLYIPATDSAIKTLIITSGLHGIEGFSGSAVQLFFLDKILPQMNRDQIAILLIHGLNPYGFKYLRKVTENNIDLNRNCVVNPILYENKNDGYAELKDFLMPQVKVNNNSGFNWFFHITAINKIVQKSMPVLRQAALQGQYSFEKGIYYGGKKYEPQIDSIKILFKQKIPSKHTVLNVDLHAAYGTRGMMHLFINPVDDPKIKDGLDIIFKDETIDWGTGSDFYTINGEYLGWMNQLVDSTLCIPMLFEFGTLNSQTTFGSLKSIQTMINENQGYHYGFSSDESKKYINNHFKEMYYPSSPMWRTQVINLAQDKLTRMMQKFENYDQ